MTELPANSLAPGLLHAAACAVRSPENRQDIACTGQQTAGIGRVYFYTCAMSRRLVFIALLLSMLLQAVSLGGYWGGLGRDDGSEKSPHVLMHWSGIAHHHGHEAPSAEAGDQQVLGDDSFAQAVTSGQSQAFHQDQSTDSSKHMALDACLHLLGPIPAAFSCPFLLASGPRPVPDEDTAPAGPVLEGLRRPPKNSV